MAMIRQNREVGYALHRNRLDILRPIARNSAYHDGILANENLNGRDYLENRIPAPESGHS